MNKFEEMLKKLKDNDVCYLYENGELKHKIKPDESIKMFAKFQGYLAYREYEFPFSFHVIDGCDLNRFEILTKEEVNQKYGECKMNFDEVVKKYDELKKNNKDVYVKYFDRLSKKYYIVKIKDYEYCPASDKIYFKKIDHCEGIISFKPTNNIFDFQILNEEEYLKENVKNIEKRLKEIEEEKKPKLEIGKTYVIRRKGNVSYHFCYVANLTSKSFYRQSGFDDTRWFNICDFDFQEVDISIKEFFTTDPKSYWKNV